MKYADLRRVMLNVPIFKMGDWNPFEKIPPHESVQLSQWVKKGLVVRLRKGLYTLPDEEKKAKISPLWLANQIYFPSYVSLEWVLSQMGLIPEMVSTVTSVTTRKTKIFSNTCGTFSYQKVQSHYFFGFRTVKNSLQSYFVAFPEKALLDFFYLSIPKSLKITEELLLHNYRLQNLDQLNLKRFQSFIKRFAHPRVQRGAEVLLKLARRSG